MSFSQFNLDAVIQRAITDLGYTQPTEIQQRAIPLIAEGRDVMASAQTGTGKTAAFVLPILQRLLTPSTRGGVGPRVLVLSPTRELAQQITDAVSELSRHMRVTSGAILGGVAYRQQEMLLRKPLDILVATPGRLMDHMGKGRVDFSRMELLVLDEADRMLDMGFVDDVEMIAKSTPAERQTLLFSATLEGEVLRVAQRLLKDPVRVQVSTIQQRHDSIEQHVHQADGIDHKHNLLAHLLGVQEMTQAIVFTATKRGADQLADHLNEIGHRAAPLHGDMKQAQRIRTVDRVKRGNVKVLVATDVAARGLDIKGISHVVNFDLPNSPEDYVHRIGRTGRGGASGKAHSLVGPQEWGNLKRIERMLGLNFERTVIAGLEPKRPEPRPGSSDGPRRFGGRPGGGRPSSSRPTSSRPSGGNGYGNGNSRSNSANSNSANSNSARPSGGNSRFNSERPSGNTARPSASRPFERSRPAAARPEQRRDEGHSHTPRESHAGAGAPARKPQVAYKPGRKSTRPSSTFTG